MFLCAWLGSVARGAPSPELRFEHVGLAHKQVNAVLRDRVGFLWVGTIDGLYRYDGYSFRAYRQGYDERLLSANDVRALAEDAEGDLWIATMGGGLNRFDRSTGTFVHYRHDEDDPSSLLSDSVMKLLLDTEGRLWVGTDKGLDRLVAAGNGAAGFRHYLPDDPRSRPEVTALLEGRGGGIWIGSGDGLDHLDPETGRRVRFRHDPADPESLGDERIEALALAADGGLWVGTLSGLDRLEAQGGRFTPYRQDPADPASLGHDYVRALTVDRHGTLWVGTAGGISVANPSAESFTTLRYSPADPLSPADDGIHAFFEDSTDLLWIGTASGLDKWNPATRAILHYRADPLSEDGLPASQVTTIVEDKDGALWAGTHSGVARLDRATGVWTTYRHDGGDPRSLSHDQVNASLVDRQGRVWLGTIRGLNRFEADTATFVRYLHDPKDPESLSGDDILDVIEGRDGRLWVGTWGGGLNRFDPATGRAVRYRHDPRDPASLPDDVVIFIYEAPSGDLWLGHNTGGLGHFDRRSGRFSSYRFDPSERNSPGSNRIFSIYGDNLGILWLGTWGGGLDRFDPATGTFRHFTEDDGLASNSVHGVLADDAGRLWIATAAGIARFDPATETFRNYGASDGFQGDELSLFAYFKSASGELFFGGWNGLSAFYPERLEENRNVPPVVLTSFQVLNREAGLGRPLLGLGELQLSYRDEGVTIEAAALDFAAPSKNHYAYRLDGSDWIELGTRREITLTHLEPGSHTLRIRGSNNHGVWNEESLTVHLQVAPPFYRTWWFETLGAVAGVLLLTLAYKVRTRAIRRRNRALAMEIVRRQQAEITLESKNLELQLKKDELELFNYAISHDLRSPLFTLQGFLGLLEQDVSSGDRERVGRDVAQIRGAAETIQRLLDELQKLWHFGNPSGELERSALGELAQEAVRRCGPRLATSGAVVEIDPELPPVLGDRRRLVEVFQILIDNAAKFMGAAAQPRIRVGARVDRGEVVVFVEDNGLGIPGRYHEKVFGLFEQLDSSSEGTGMGLAIAKRVVQMHGGRIWVESEGSGRGSRFCMVLPVEVEHEKPALIGSSLRPL